MSLDIESRLIDYQVPSLRILEAALSSYAAALDASDGGTGKTYVAIALAQKTGRPLYVVCPKPVIPGWQRAGKHFGVDVVAANYERLRTGFPGLVTIGEHKRDLHWSLPKETLIVFDECHRMANPYTLNAALGLAALRQGYPVLALSATAAEDPSQMKFLGLLCRLFARERDFSSWLTAHDVRPKRNGFQFVGDRGVLRELHARIFPAHGSRIRIADLGDRFPESQITAELYDIGEAAGKAAQIYQEMAEEIVRLEAKENHDRSRQACILTTQLRARQRVELLKVPAVVEVVQDAVAEGHSVVLFVNFNETLDALLSRLETDCVVRGGQSAEDRERFIQSFQQDKSRVLVANIASGGEGIGLHGTPQARTRLAIHFPTWSARIFRQALLRVWRQNGARSLQRVFCAVNTIEEAMCARLRLKLSRIDTLNDGDLALKGENPLAFDIRGKQKL